MKAIHLITVTTLAMTLGVTALAAAEPAQPNPSAPAQYNPKELSVDKIQSSRDAASGQAAASGDRYANQEVSYVKPAQPTETIVSPRDPPSGHASGIQDSRPDTTANVRLTDVMLSSQINSPRDPASGQATGRQQTPQPDGFTGADGRSMSFELINSDAGQGQSSPTSRTTNPNQPNNLSLSSSTPGSTVVAPPSSGGNGGGPEANQILSATHTIVAPVSPDGWVIAADHGLSIKSPSSDRTSRTANPNQPDNFSLSSSTPGSTVQSADSGAPTATAHAIAEPGAVNPKTTVKKRPKNRRNGSNERRQHKP